MRKIKMITNFRNKKQNSKTLRTFGTIAIEKERTDRRQTFSVNVCFMASRRRTSVRQNFVAVGSVVLMQ